MSAREIAQRDSLFQRRRRRRCRGTDRLLPAAADPRHAGGAGAGRHSGAVRRRSRRALARSADASDGAQRLLHRAAVRRHRAVPARDPPRARHLRQEPAGAVRPPGAHRDVAAGDRARRHHALVPAHRRADRDRAARRVCATTSRTASGSTPCSPTTC